MRCCHHQNGQEHLWSLYVLTMPRLHINVTYKPFQPDMLCRGIFRHPPKQICQTYAYEGTYMSPRHTYKFVRRHPWVVVDQTSHRGPAGTQITSYFAYSREE